VPLLIQHGAADDWVPAAPCVTLAERMQRLGYPVQAILYADAHHGFDAPRTPLQVLPKVWNPNATGERGAHVGTHEPARRKAIDDTKAFLDGQLAR
jgi:dienelactone hydrolase